MAVAAGKYNHVKVKLTGKDGNAFMILGLVRRALLNAKVDPAEVTAYINSLMQVGSYDELLRTLLQDMDVR